VQRILLLVAAIGSAAGAPAAAQESADWRICSSAESDADKAIAACSRLVGSAALQPADRAAARFNRATFHLRKGEADRAIADYSALLAFVPGNPIIHNHRGEAYSYKADFVRALADYDEAVRLNPRYPLAFRNRARIHFHRGDFAAAAEDFRTAEAIDRSNGYSLLWRYVAEARAGVLDRAGLHGGAALVREGWPKPLVLHFLDRVGEAETLAAATAGAEPRAHACEAHFFLGQKRILAGEAEAATAALRRALALCPRHMVEHHAARVELRRLGAP
jgi:lipoprotein NlpI